MAEKAKKKGYGTGRSLNIVLWFSFTAFAVVIIAVLLFGQNLLAGRWYRGRAKESLADASDRIVAALTEGADLSVISDIAHENGLSACLVYEEERTVVTYAGAERSYQSFASLSDLPESSSETVFFSSDEEFACVRTVTVGGSACNLYLAMQLELFQVYQSASRLSSLVTGAFAVVLAFVASGLLASFIAKPVVEVTERAKELARGNYELKLRKDYYCSEISELSEALESAREEISKADSVQKELIANISHDFRTPLTMIKAYASMIREISGENKEKRDAHAQVILDEADRLATLVEDVLDLSKLRAGLVEENRTVFNLSEEVYAIAGRFAYLTETQGYRFELAVEDDLYAQADRARIGQVLYNLIGNAVNYTGTDKRVRIKLTRKGEAARFEVIDSGKGIPADEVDTIWDRYYRSAQTHKRPVGGTGLGLSIVKGILLAHEIPFGVISEVGKGSCFWVEFPPVSSGEKKKEEL